MAYEIANEEPYSKLRFIVMLDDTKTLRPPGKLGIVTPPRFGLGGNAVLLMRRRRAALLRGVREPVSVLRWASGGDVLFSFHGQGFRRVQKVDPR